LPLLAVADLIAYQDLLASLRTTARKRAQIQRRRRRDDAEIFPLLDQPFWMVEQEPRYESVFQTVRDFFALDSLFQAASLTPVGKGIRLPGGLI
jgi:hypothetical protein